MHTHSDDSSDCTQTCQPVVGAGVAGGEGGYYKRYCREGALQVLQTFRWGVTGHDVKYQSVIMLMYGREGPVTSMYM